MDVEDCPQMQLCSLMTEEDWLPKQIKEETKDHPDGSSEHTLQN
jgi:hypothetical protein